MIWLIGLGVVGVIVGYFVSAKIFKDKGHPNRFSVGVLFGCMGIAIGCFKSLPYRLIDLDNEENDQVVSCCWV